MTVKESLSLQPGDEVLFVRYPGSYTDHPMFTIGKIYKIRETPDWANKDTHQNKNTVLIIANNEGRDDGWQAYCFERATPTTKRLFGGKS